ncbi:MAG: glycosyltransferase, partial [Ignavibacteriales bacterium]|nr:glycosyltransferase [Ignavibacteriales bacterium]
MKICFATYSAVMMLKGGPRTQILQTKSELERLGVSVDLLDAWSEFDRAKYDLVHVFAANVGTYHLANVLRLNGVPFVVSPIFYTQWPSAFVKILTAAGGVVQRIVPGSMVENSLRLDMCRWSKAVLPNTSEEAALVHDGLGIESEKIFVVPNGVEERFANATPDLFREQHDIDKFILNVGHIGPKRK